MTGYNDIAAYNLYGMYPPSTYYNQVAMNDLTDMDLYAPQGGFMTNPLMNPMMNSAMSMNGSLFSPAMGMYPMAGGSDPASYLENYQKYQDFMIDNQVHQQQKWRDANLRLNSPQEGIQKQAAILHEKIMTNEQTQIVEAFAAFKESVRALYGDNATEDQISNRACALYRELNNGVGLTEDIRKYSRDSLTQGFLQSATFGLLGNKTAEENIAELTGQPVGRNEKVKKLVGNAIGGATVGALGSLGLGLLWKAKGPVAKFLFKVPVLASIGAAIACVTAFSSKK